MMELVDSWLAFAGLENSESAYMLMVLALILLISLLVHLVLHKVVFRALARSSGSSRHLWQQALVEHDLFKRLAFTLQGIILFTQTRIWLADDAVVRPFIEVLTLQWVLLFAFLSLYSLISAIELAAGRTTVGQSLPLRGLAQGFKLLAAIIAIILGLSLLIGKSPLILFSGLGAMTAVLLLVFKDPLLGLVAGVQLSANDMLKVGDWLEMPKYGADGDVIDISLTTVKVQNWDKTITTIPSYALIADSFKNWRGMSDAGGRRIKRAFNIDVSSVHFLDEEEVQRLRGLQLIANYIEDKIRDIEADNKARNIDVSSPANGRRLTNIGTLRAYLTQYLKANPNIHPDMTTMVRQLAPGPHGIPLEIYCFSSNTDWVDYEGIQADISDHILAVMPQFNLRIHQNPTGHDLQQIGSAGGSGN